MTTRTSVAALILNWNGAADTCELLQCLDSIDDASIKITTVVIDNASKPQDRHQLEAFIKNEPLRMTTLYRANPLNIGVPAGYNQAVAMAGPSHDYYLRLDNDVTLVPNGLQLMIDAMRRTHEEGVRLIGGNTKLYDQPATDNGGAVRIDLLAGRTEVSYPEADTICDGVLGCIVLLDGGLVRHYFPEVFDSSLFLCTDESELSLRARSKGWLTLYLSATIGCHKSGQSTGKVDFSSRYFSARNWTILRLRFTSGANARCRIFASIVLGMAANIVRLRWAYPLGVATGLLLHWASCLDLRQRPSSLG